MKYINQQLKWFQLIAAGILLLLISSPQAAAQTWIHESPTGTLPTGRYGSGRAYDAINDRSEERRVGKECRL